jgi:hypothetical protein
VSRIYDPTLYCRMPITDRSQPTGYPNAEHVKQRPTAPIQSRVTTTLQARLATNHAFSYSAMCDFFFSHTGLHQT